MPPTIPMSALVVEALDLANPPTSKYKLGHFNNISEEELVPVTKDYDITTPEITLQNVPSPPVVLEKSPNSKLELDSNVTKSLINSLPASSKSENVVKVSSSTIGVPPCPFTNPSISSFTKKFSFESSLFPIMAGIDLETVKELGLAILYAVYGIIVAFFMTFVPRRFRYKNINGQVVLITGAGSGIGRLMAKKFALKHGAIVVAWDINKQGNDETVREIRSFGGKCHGYVADVSSRESIYEVSKKVRAEVGKVDILINNAGIVSGNKLLETSDAQIEKTFQVNSLSNFWTTKAFLPDMQKTGRGHIVTIASLAGMFGTSRLVDYCASKYAAVGFDEALRNELKCDESTKNLNTTLVCPYYINTGMFDGVRSKIVPILSPEPVVNDIVAGVLTNQECIIIPRYVYLLILIKNVVPGEVGRRLASAFGFTSGMLHFRGRTSGAVKNGSK